MIAVTDPRTGSLLEKYSSSSPEEVDEAVNRSILALGERRTETYRHRQRMLMDAIDLLASVVEDWATADLPARGVSEQQALHEATASLDVLRFYAGAARDAQAPAAGEYLVHRYSSVTYRPLGVLGVILPWNYPMLMLAWRLGPILAAGCTAVVKPDERTRHSAYMFADAMTRTLGRGTVEVVVGSGDVGAELSRHPRLAGMVFTGSRQTGMQVQRACSPRPAFLELGGNCPALFFDDAPAGSEDDLVRAAVFNAGQSCAAPSRVIVNNKHALERVLEAVRRSTANTPLISPQALERTESRVAAAGITAQGTALSLSNGFWFPPTACVVPAGSSLALRVEETFAPVITVEKITESIYHMIGSALDPACNNDLAASVWTSSLSKAMHASTELSRHVGEVWVNTHLEQSPELPHSGGHGIDMSRAAVEQYRRPSTVTVRI